MSEPVSQANLRVGIDPTKSVQGSRVVTRSLDDIKNSAKGAMGAVGDLSSKLGGVNKDSNGVRVVNRDVRDLANSSSSAASQVATLKNALLHVAGAAAGIYGIATAIYKIKEYAQDTLTYLAKIESATLGIAASFLVSGQFIDRTTGKVIKGQQALAAGQMESKKIIDQLRVANYQTSATLDELIFAYEVTLPVAMAKGFDKRQVMEFTLAMVQAAGSIGLAYDQISEETRSILTGNVTRNSRIAQILQLSNNQEYLSKVKQGGTELFDYLELRLAGFKLAGMEVNKTWAGMWSNFKDIARQGSGFAFEGLFATIKKEVQSLMNHVMSIDLVTKEITWNPEFLSASKSVGDAMVKVFNAFVTGTKWIYEHTAAIKLAAEIYIGYKVALLVAELSQRVFTRAVTEQVVAEEIKRKSIFELMAVERAHSQALVEDAARTAANTQAIVAETEARMARVNVLRVSAAAQTAELKASLSSLEIKRVQTIAEMQLLEVENAAHSRRIANTQALLAQIAVEQKALSDKSTLTAKEVAFQNELRNQEWNSINRLNVLMNEQAVTLQKLDAARIKSDLIAAESSTIRNRLAASKAKETALSRLATAAENQHAVAVVRSSLAQAAHTAALRATTVAQLALNAVKTTGAAILGFFGGWVGLVTVALIAGYMAWEKWGNASEKALKQAKQEADGFETTVKQLERQYDVMMAINRVQEAEASNTTPNANDKMKETLGEMGYHALKESEDRVESLLKRRSELFAQARKKQTIFGESDLPEKLRKEAEAIREAVQMEEIYQKRQIAAATKIKEEQDRLTYEANKKTQDQEEIERRNRERNQLEQAKASYLEAARNTQLVRDKEMMDSQLNQEKTSFDARLTAHREYYEKVRDIEKRYIQQQIDANSKTVTDLENSSVLKTKGPQSDKIMTLQYKVLKDIEESKKKGIQLSSQLEAVDREAARNITTSLKEQKRQYEEISIDVLKMIDDQVELTKADLNSINSRERLLELTVELNAATSKGDLERAAAASKALAQIQELNGYLTTMAELEEGRKIQDKSAEVLNPYERDIALINNKYDFEEKRIKALLKIDEMSTRKKEALHKELAANDILRAREVYSRTLNEMASYTSMAGELFTQLANSQDQSSKSGFESAKNFNRAATIMNTASAIMAQLATPGPVGWASAALAAATGIIQLSKINSTSFGGEGSVSSPGNFGSGGSGGIGTVLGDKNKATESINNSNELLEDIHVEEYRELQKISKGIDSLNFAFAGVAASILRNLGLEASSFNVAVGTTLGQYEKFFDKTGGKAMRDIDSNFLTNSEGGGRFDPLSYAVTKYATQWAGKIMGKVFGGETKVSVTGSGLVFGSSSFGDIMSGKGMDISTYADIYKKTDGGVLGKTKRKRWTTYGEVDDETAALFQSMFEGLGGTLTALAENFGTDVQKVLDYSFELGKVDLQGLTGEEISKKIAELFSYAGDKAAEAIFGDLILQYQQIDEGLLETAVRLAVTKTVVLDILDKTGAGLVNVGDMTTESLINLSQSLIEIAGGLDTLKEKADFYYGAFFSEEEQQARLQGQLYESLRDIDMILPSTREGYRKLVESLDLTNLADQERYVRLLDLAEAADQYYGVLEDATASYKDMVLEVIDIQLAATEALEKLVTGGLSVLSPEQKYLQLRNEFEDQKQKSLAGDWESQRNLPGLIDELLNASRSYYASGAGYVNDYNSAVEALSAIASMTPSSATQLDLLQTQIDRLTEIRESVDILGSISREFSEALIQLIKGGASAEEIGNLTPFASGTSYVDRDMPAQIHEGEMIIDRASAEVFRKYGISVHSGSSKGIEDRLDKVVSKLEEVERRLASIDTKARLAANQ